MPQNCVAGLVIIMSPVHTSWVKGHFCGTTLGGCLLMLVHANNSPTPRLYNYKLEPGVIAICNRLLLLKLLPCTTEKSHSSKSSYFSTYQGQHNRDSCQFSYVWKYIQLRCNSTTIWCNFTTIWCMFRQMIPGANEKASGDEANTN